MPGNIGSLMSRYTLLRCLLGLLCLAPICAFAVECSELQFRGTRCTVCRVDLHTDRLQLFQNDATGKPFTSFRRLAESLAGRNEQLAFAMNAGMYREDYSPLGLLVINGQQIHRINLASGYGNFYIKPNGVFLLSASGARIVESTQYRSLTDAVLFATQSGPLLLQGGAINPAFNPEGDSRLIRNGVGVVSADQVVFAISEEPVNFYEFALLFRDRLKCADALYLDGNVSSLYSQALGRHDERVLLGPLIGVVVSAKH
jgi:uncharacterized protein YigE (DUF2233 family)